MPTDTTQSTSTPKPYGENSAITTAGLGAGGFTSLGTAVGSVVPGIGTGIGFAVGAGLDLLSGIFGSASKRRAEKRAQEANLKNQNIDRRYQWDVYDARRDEEVDTIPYQVAMAKGNARNRAQMRLYGDPNYGNLNYIDTPDLENQVAMLG